MQHELVCAGGNSLGWYTALAVAGALSFEDGFRLVQTMSLLQAEEQEGAGGQLIYPLVDADWRPLPERAAAVREALASSGGEALPSIHLGGYAVLAGSERGLEHLVRALPPVQLGKANYPFRLVQHGPYHTPLVEPVADRARKTLSELPFRPPRVTLIDGLGRRHTPWSADPAELARYTLGAQIVEPYDFTAGVRVALREYAPDAVVLPGPENTLGGVVGQVLVAERWRGITCRDDFERAQAGDDAPVLSMRR